MRWSLLLPFVMTMAQSDPLDLVLRQRQSDPSDGTLRPVTRQENWEAERTAVIVCDMWDLHHCRNAVLRLREMAPRANDFISACREAGALVIHAPSDCMEFYRGHPARQRALDVPRSDSLPGKIGEWCHIIPSEEGRLYPLDQSDGGEDDNPVDHAAWARHLTRLGRDPRAPWKRQYDVIDIRAEDAISDKGEEIWSLMEHHGIDNVILLGVHTNMCVLGRPFGLRQMVRNGKNVVLVRDLTDSMYNPARWPHVDHFEGTRRIVEYIEAWICPTITSDRILGGSPFRFAGDSRR